MTIYNFLLADVACQGITAWPFDFIYVKLFFSRFELALREYEIDVTLPYWDVTLDSQLEWPAQSLIWGPQYAGNGNGLVNSGPFANWDIQGRKLMRNIGHSGRLMKPNDVTKIMTGSMSISDIIFPNAEFENNLELHSYGVRRWVGGDMALLQTSMNDPMYSMDPETDWPVKFSGYTAHFPIQELGVVPAIRNRAGLRDRYASGASCHGNSGYQNSYCLDGNNCDERDWVYLSIQVSYIRPDEFSYPVKAFTSPSTRATNDIYSAVPFSNGAYNVSLRNKGNSPHRSLIRASAPARKLGEFMFRRTASITTELTGNTLWWTSAYPFPQSGLTRL
ncbi:tyrosinase-like protein 1 [Liolophura sinensis]|uniref:tyrosinase-like protein 1 n=1 Tax=Liolophura sinensis TaxID=3198878 RepID=UPI003158F2F5